MFNRYVKRVVDGYHKLAKRQDKDTDGREIPDPVPIAPPIGWFKQPSMFDQVRDMVRSEHLRLYAEAQGAESFEEANDFEVEDEMFPTSPHEGEFYSAEELQARRQAAFREQFLKERDERYIKRKAREWDAEKAAEASPSPVPSSSGARSAALGAAEKGGSEASPSGS